MVFPVQHLLVMGLAGYEAEALFEVVFSHQGVYI